jgi:formate/nitrite transporter FocA (FNT family)
MKIILTFVVLMIWASLMFGNLVGAGLTAGQMQLREGISREEAQHRTTLLVLLWAVVLTATAVAALLVIW